MQRHSTNFGRRLKRLRLLNGYSQLRLEIEAEISPGTISKIEHGRVNPSKETLFRIGLALQLDLNGFLHLFGLDNLVSTQTDFSFVNQKQ